MMTLPSHLLKTPIPDPHMVSNNMYNRYSNPFEQKWALKPEFYSAPPFADVFSWMESTIQQAHPMDMLDIYKHYHGLFIYEPGDFLAIHVDAGIHPKAKLKKAHTMVLYFTEAILQFWDGTPCTRLEPRVTSLRDTVHFDPGEWLIFENDAHAWHGVPPTSERRIVFTISTVSLDTPVNWLERAYFVPYPDEVWPPDVIKLRDTRAHPEKYAEVYQTNEAN